MRPNGAEHRGFGGQSLVFSYPHRRFALGQVVQSGQGNAAPVGHRSRRAVTDSPGAVSRPGGLRCRAVSGAQRREISQGDRAVVSHVLHTRHTFADRSGSGTLPAGGRRRRATGGTARLAPGQRNNCRWWACRESFALSGPPDHRRLRSLTLGLGVAGCGSIAVRGWWRSCRGSHDCGTVCAIALPIVRALPLGTAGPPLAASAPPSSPRRRDSSALVRSD
jgi:hypothetical protein